MIRWYITPAAGWTAEMREEVSFGERWRFMVLAPESADASLRITPDERDVMPPSKWEETTARIDRLKGRRVLECRFGDFAGHSVEFSAEDEWIRGWVLFVDKLALDATYRCKLHDAGRDDLAIESMLNSLRLEDQ